MDYVPFDATEDEASERQVLRPGVPATMRKPLTTWILKQISTDRGYVYPAPLHEIENNLDVSFGLNPDFTGLITESDARKLFGNLDERELLRSADYLLYKAGRFVRNEKSLDRLLREGRSQYFVNSSPEGCRLASRVPEGVLDAAEAIADVSETAGRLLRRAWTKVHDLDPDDSGAYVAAVRAVEAAALPVLGITKETATVSDAVRAIEKRDADWRLPFRREHTEYPSKTVLLAMLKSLYRGQHDRHGSAAYEDVSHEEAEAAVLLAVTLVGWFAGGLVAERDAETFG